MRKQEIQELKQQYNYNLQRLYNGYKYCKDHIEEMDMWIPELNRIVDNLEKLLEKIKKSENVNTDQILGGFKDG